MQTKVELITPAIAKKMLEKNTNNRPIRWHHVQKLAEELLADEWQTTHQGIAFNNAGFLIDGQHRLNAIVQAGKAVTMSVTRGCDVRAFDVLDRGVNRSLSDIMGIHQRMAEVITMALQISNGTSKVTPSMIRDLEGTKFFEWADRFNSDFTTCKPKVTQTSVRLAAVINLVESDNKEFIYHQMTALQKQEYKDMTPCCASFNKQISKNKMSRPEVLSKALVVFDESRKDTQRLISNEEIIENANGRVRSIIKNQQ